jgi:hypothetical protein
MLQIDINGAWEPADFIDVLESIESMYFKCLDFEDMRYSVPHWSFTVAPFNRVASEHMDAVNRHLLDFSRYTADSETRLSVKRISYASPGSIDLIGIGRAFDAIARTIERIIRFYEERDIRREKLLQEQIATEHKRQTLRSLEIKNAREILKLQKDFPRSAKDLLLPLLVRDQERIAERVAQGKIVKIRRTGD